MKNRHSLPVPSVLRPLCTWLTFAVAVLFAAELQAQAPVASHIAAGDGHVGYIDAAGTLWTWGANDEGQLGREGAADPSPYPGEVDFNGVAVTQVAFAGNTSYAIAAGKLYTWGSNENFLLGRGESPSVTNLPKQVSFPDPLNLGQPTIVWVSASKTHALAIDNNGYMYLWGKGSEQQLGTAGTVDEAEPYILVKRDEDPASPTHLLPVRADGTVIQADTDVVPWEWSQDPGAAIAGDGFTIAIAANGANVVGIPTERSGELYGWGSPFVGRLGAWNDSRPEFDDFIKVTFPTPLDLVNGNPVLPVDGVAGGRGWVALSAGDFHTMGLYRPTAGAAIYEMYVWGLDASGRLGQENLNESSIQNFEIEVPQNLGTGWKSVGAGKDFSLAIDDNDTIWGFGNNIDTQLNNRSRITDTKPRTADDNPVTPQVETNFNFLSVKTPIWVHPLGGGPWAADNWQEVAGGSNFTVTLDASGNPYVVGDNEKGQFGNGTVEGAGVVNLAPSLTAYYNRPDIQPSVDYKVEITLDAKYALDDLFSGNLIAKVSDAARDAFQSGAPGFLVNFYYSEDASLDTLQDTLITQKLIAATNEEAVIEVAADGADEFGAVDVQPLPAGVEPGEAFFIAEIIPQGAIDSDETNNEASASTQLSNFRLSPQSVEIAGGYEADRLQPGTNISIIYSVKNDGLSDFDSAVHGVFNIKAYLTDADTLTPSADTQLNGANGAASAILTISADATAGETLGTTLALPASLEPGDYILYINALPANPAQENTFGAAEEALKYAQLAVTVIGPEPVATSISLPETQNIRNSSPAFASGGGFPGDVLVQVKNNGEITLSDALELNLYLSKNNTYEESDAKITTAPVAFNNGVGATLEGQEIADVTIPAANIMVDAEQLPGDYFIIARVEVPTGSADTFLEGSTIATPAFVSNFDLRPANLRLVGAPSTNLAADGATNYTLAFNLVNFGLNAYDSAGGTDGSFTYTVDLVGTDGRTLDTVALQTATLAAKDGSTPINVNFTVPETQLPGSYALQVSVTLPEKPALEDPLPNNTSSIAVNVVKQYDLALTAFNLEQSTFAVENATAPGVDVVLENKADSTFTIEDTNALEFEVFLSEDGILDEVDDLLVASKTLDSSDPDFPGAPALTYDLNRNDQISVNLTSLDLSNEARPGPYTLFVRVLPAEDHIVDDDLSNNTLSASVVLSDVDLQLLNINVPDVGTDPDSGLPQLGLRQPFDVSYDVRNLGKRGYAAPDNTYAIRAFLSTDETLESGIGGDRQIGNFTAQSITLTAAGTANARATAAQLVDLTLPSEVAPGNYYLILEILLDAQSKESATAQTNNSTAIPVAVSGPDPAIDAFTIPEESTDINPTTYGIGADLPGGGSFEIVVKNLGGTALNSNLIANIYLSEDTVVDENDDSLSGDQTVDLESSPLAPQDTVAINFNSLAIRYDAEPGDYYIIAEISLANESIGENDATNNIVSKVVRLEAPNLTLDETIVGISDVDQFAITHNFSNIDLTVSNLTAGAVPTPLEQTNAGVTVKRIGVQVYLSQDDVLDTDNDTALLIDDKGTPDPSDDEPSTQQFTFQDTGDPTGGIEPFGTLDLAQVNRLDIRTLRLNNFTVDPNISGGDYTMFFVVNPSGDVVEADSGSGVPANNIVKQTVTFTANDDPGPTLDFALYATTDTDDNSPKEWTRQDNPSSINGLVWQSPDLTLDPGDPIDPTSSLFYEFQGIHGDVTEPLEPGTANDVAKLDVPVRLITEGNDFLSIYVYEGRLVNDAPAPNSNTTVDVLVTQEVRGSQVDVTFYRPGVDPFIDADDVAVTQAELDGLTVTDGAITVTGVTRIVGTGLTKWLTPFTFLVPSSGNPADDGRRIFEWRFTRDNDGSADVQSIAQVALVRSGFSETTNIPLKSWRAYGVGQAPSTVVPGLTAVQGGTFAGIEFSDPAETGTATLSTTVYGPALIAFNFISFDENQDGSAAPAYTAENKLDTLSFRINGVEQTIPTDEFNAAVQSADYRADGVITDWNDIFGNQAVATQREQQSYFLIPPGQHTLEWRATKQSTNRVFAAYLDNLIFRSPIPENYPDLSIDEITVEPGPYILDSVGADATFPVTMRVKNRGADLLAPTGLPDATQFAEILLYFSENDFIEEDQDYRVGSFPLVSNDPGNVFMESGQQLIFSEDIVLPLDIPAGEYKLLALVLARDLEDPTNPSVTPINGYLPEYTLGNNLVTEELFQIIRAPDLIARNLNLGSLLGLDQHPEDFGQISYDVINRGLGPVLQTDTFKVRVDLVYKLKDTVDANYAVLQTMTEFDVNEFMPERNAQNPDISIINYENYVRIPTLRDLLAGIGLIDPTTPEDSAEVSLVADQIRLYEFGFFITVDTTNAITESSETNTLLFGGTPFTIVPVPAVENYGIFTGNAGALDLGTVDVLANNSGAGALATNSSNDLDGDEVYNFLEYASGGNPVFGTNLTSFNPAARTNVNGLIVAPSSLERPYLVTTFDFNNRAEDVVFKVFGSSNLADINNPDPDLINEQFLLVEVAPPIINLSQFNGLADNPFVLALNGRTSLDFDLPDDGNGDLFGNFDVLRDSRVARITIRDKEAITAAPRFLRVAVQPSVDLVQDFPRAPFVRAFPNGEGDLIVSIIGNPPFKGAFHLERTVGTPDNGNWELIEVIDPSGYPDRFSLTPTDWGLEAYTFDEDLDGGATISVYEDANNNGVLDGGEDLDGDGVLDLIEDLNSNGILDDGEDLNGNAKLDLSEDFDGNGLLETYQLYRYFDDILAVNVSTNILVNTAAYVYSYEDTNVSADFSYTYRVRAVNIAGATGKIVSNTISP